MKDLTQQQSTEIMALAKKRVGEWMTPNPITVLPNTHVSDAFKLMRERNIRRLPVIEDGKLVGIVTLGDLRSLGGGTESPEADKLRVDAGLHTDLITVSRDATLVAAARLMIQHKVSGLPVLSETDQSLVGMITESDIFRAFIKDEVGNA